MLKTINACTFLILLLCAFTTKAQNGGAPGTLAITGKIISTKAITVKDTAHPIQCCTKIKVVHINGRGPALTGTLSEGDTIKICASLEKKNKKNHKKERLKEACNGRPKGEEFTATLHEHFMLGNKYEYSLENYKTIKNKK